MKRVVPPSTAVLRHSLVHLQGPLGQLHGSPGILLQGMVFKDADVTQIPVFFQRESSVHDALGQRLEGAGVGLKIQLRCLCCAF